MINPFQTSGERVLWCGYLVRLGVGLVPIWSDLVFWADLVRSGDLVVKATRSPDLQKAPARLWQNGALSASFCASSLAFSDLQYPVFGV